MLLFNASAHLKQKCAFLLQLPMDVLSSMHNDYFGWISYTCTGLLAISDNTCFIRLSGNNELVVEKPITVFSMLNLDAPHFRLPSTAADSVELVGCCRKHGSLSAKVILACVCVCARASTKTLRIQCDQQDNLRLCLKS